MTLVYYSQEDKRWANKGFLDVVSTFNPFFLHVVKLEAFCNPVLVEESRKQRRSNAKKLTH